MLDPTRYLAPFGIPSVSRDDSSFRPGFHFFHCWRGPSWVNTAWLLAPPMGRLGYEAEADHVVDSLLGASERHGFREYYNPLTGEGLAARHFGWSTLLLDLVARLTSPAQALRGRNPGTSRASTRGSDRDEKRTPTLITQRTPRSRRAPTSSRTDRSRAEGLPAVRCVHTSFTAP